MSGGLMIQYHHCDMECVESGMFHFVVADEIEDEPCL